MRVPDGPAAEKRLDSSPFHCCSFSFDWLFIGFSVVFSVFFHRFFIGFQCFSSVFRNWLHFVLVLWSLGEVTIMADDEAGTGSTLYMRLDDRLKRLEESRRMLRFCRVTKAFRIFRLMSSFHVA